MPKISRMRSTDTAWPRCIHLAGADGSGKTTQARALVRHLEESGFRVRRVWLRHPRLFSVPFLAYARMRGYSSREKVAGIEHGYWNFGSSWLLQTIFPWVLLLDTALLALVRVHIPLLWGGIVVCDRFVVDTLADLMVGLGKGRYDVRPPGSWFLALLPSDAQVVVMDLDTKVAQQRSPDLAGDRTHALRRQTYLEMASRQGWAVLSSDAPVEAVTQKLVTLLSRD